MGRRTQHVNARPAYRDAGRSHPSFLGDQLGRVHLWLAPPLQSQISSWVPLALPEPGTSRQRPDWTLFRVPSDCGVHCWLVPPLQSHRSMSVPLAVPWPVTSTHLPADPPSRSWPLPHHHVWAAPPLQSQSWILVPLVVEPPSSSTHLPARPDLTGPMCCGEAVPGVRAKLSNWSVW